MTPYDDERELTDYIWQHYAQFLTETEAKANIAFYAEGKARAGQSPVAKYMWERHKLAEDSAVMAALANGVDAFRNRTAQRILTEHASKVFVNRCARCDRVVRTPKAQQCLWCGHDWHPALDMS